MGNERYLPQLFSSAQQYQAHLLDKDFLIVGQMGTKRDYTYIEAKFLDHHFMHLTGCQAVTGISPSRFYQLCLDKRIGPRQFTTSPETQLKLRVLPMLCELTKTAKMIGPYGGGGNYLYTETLTGGVKGCLGFVRGDDGRFFAPNTVLDEDIRKLVSACYQVVAIYEKPVSSQLYPHAPKYLAKALKHVGDKLTWTDEINTKLEYAEKISAYKDGTPPLV